MKSLQVTSVKVLEDDGLTYHMEVIEETEVEVPDQVITPLEKLARILEVKGFLTATDVKDLLGA